MNGRSHKTKRVNSLLVAKDLKSRHSHYHWEPTQAKPRSKFLSNYSTIPTPSLVTILNYLIALSSCYVISYLNDKHLELIR